MTAPPWRDDFGRTAEEAVDEVSNTLPSTIPLPDLIASLKEDAYKAFYAATRIEEAITHLERLASLEAPVGDSVATLRDELYMQAKSRVMEGANFADTREVRAGIMLVRLAARLEAADKDMEGEIFYAFAFGMGEDGGLDQGQAQVTWKRAKEFAEKRMKERAALSLKEKKT